MKLLNSLLNNEWFKPIAALVIGWLLSEVSHYLLARRERRKAISGALSDLLEIRHQFIALNVTVNELKKLIPAELLTADTEAQLRVALAEYMRQQFPKWQEMSQKLGDRFDESVTLVASIDPILGYKLRSKDLVQHFFGVLDSICAGDAKTAALWSQVNQAVFEDLTKELDTHVTSLAWKLGPISRRRTASVLAKDRKIPEPAQRVFGMMRKAIEQSMPKPVTPPSAAIQTEHPNVKAASGGDSTPSA